jgi:hypothetical protein
MLGVVVEQRTSMVGFLQFINNDVGIVGAPLWLVTLAALGRHSRHPLLWSSSTSCEHVSWNEHELSHRLSISTHLNHSLCYETRLAFVCTDLYVISS